MRSMVEELAAQATSCTCSAMITALGPSTAFHAVPLPIRFADGED